MVLKRKHFLRDIIVLGLPLIGLLWGALPSFAQDWECRDCPKRTLGVFDVAVPPAGADATLSYGDWLTMHMVSGGVLGTFMDDDPSRDCLSFYDTQRIENLDKGEGGHQAGGLHLPPPGPIDFFDYIVTGAVAISEFGRDYILALSLQAAGSREEVASVSVPYDLSISGAENGKQAASNFVPLMGFIRDFERRKRDENFGMAIEVKDEKVEVIPQRRKVAVNETVDVKFRLSDCDDERLKDRIIVPRSTGGQFLTSRVPKTDENGEVTLTFHAGDKTGRAKLMGVYPYVYPFGKEAVPAQGEKGIEIADHYLSAQITVKNESHFRQDEQDDRGNIKKKTWDKSQLVTVHMDFDTRPERVYQDFDPQKGTLVPRGYTFKLTGYSLGTSTYNAHGNSYEYSAWGRRETTASASESGTFSGLQPSQDGIPLRLDLDPATQKVIRVHFPALKGKISIKGRRNCTKKERDKVTDCGYPLDHESGFSSQDGSGGDECYEVKGGDGKTFMSGGCVDSYRSKYDTRKTSFEWELHWRR